MTLTEKLKSGTKRLVAGLFYRSGVLWFLARHRLRGKAVVLMYHRVLPENRMSKSFSHPGIIVTPESFDRQMAFLKRHFSPMPLSDFIHHIETGRAFPDRACLITFDDGWVDNYEYALPILRRHQLPAVVFAATDFIGSDNTLWQERLGHLLHQASTHSVCRSILDESDITLPGPENESRLRHAIAAAVDHYRGESYEQIHELITRLNDALAAAGHTNLANPTDRFMDWPQLKELQAHGVSVESHACSHRHLNRIHQDSVRHELRASRMELSARLGRETTAIAYPGGKHDDTVRREALEAGYQVGFTTSRGPASSLADPLLVPRMNIHEANSCTEPLFLRRMVKMS